jgi:hypothetical protein
LGELLGSMTVFGKGLIAAAVWANLNSQADAETLNIGVMSSTDKTPDSWGQSAQEVWEDWVASANLDFAVTVNRVMYNASTLTADVAALAANNHVLVPPYTSGRSKSFINAVSDADKPILVWGGAADDIFDTACVGKSCFGTFSKGSDYMGSAIMANMALSSGPVTAMLVTNTNSFSAFVCNGAISTIGMTDGISQVGATLSADPTAVTAAVNEFTPDVMIVCGHNGDVESVIAAIKSATHTPRAIIATNSITSSAVTHYAAMVPPQPGLISCMQMPDQWGRASTVDSIVGWTSDAFTTAYTAKAGSSPAYHAASMGGAMIALTHAMAAGNAANRTTGAVLSTLLRGVSTPSFYGQLSFAMDGAIQKPVYFQQYQTGGAMTFSTMYGNLEDDLKMCPDWGTPNTCGAIRDAYKAQTCCGNPTQLWSTGRRLTATKP